LNLTLEKLTELRCIEDGDQLIKINYGVATV